MGIYIKGMEMPEYCGYCRFRYAGICHALQKTQYSMEECPLVPVPPHGRLIDADELCTRLLSAWDTVNREKKMMISAVMADVVTPIVVGTPTIIPAEDEENHDQT